MRDKSNTTTDSKSRAAQEPRDWPEVAISVLNWNGWCDTLNCLESLQQLSYPNCLTVVVDNGSWDDSVEKIKVWAKKNLGEISTLVEYDRLTALEGGKNFNEEALEKVPAKTKLVLIRNEENLGFTGGNNVAIRYALQKRCPSGYIFLLNNDAKVEKDCVTNLVTVARKTNAGIVGAVIKDENNGKKMTIPGQPEAPFPLIRQFFQPIVRWPATRYKSVDDFWPCVWTGGAAMLILGDALRAVYASTKRYLDNRLFLYGEEVELCHIARELGYKSVTTKLVSIYHKDMGSSGGNFNPMAYYYINRNHILLAKQLLPAHLEILFFAINIPICFVRILKNLVYSRPISAHAVLCALIDGYRGVIGKWKYHDREVIRHWKAQSCCCTPSTKQKKQL